MTTLVWNLEENATRRHLLAEALLQLPEERRAQVLEAAEAAGVSDGHHHALGEVNAAIDALVDLKQNVYATIQKVEKPEYQFLLEMRYLCFKTWAEIADQMHLEEHYVFRVHGQALREVEKILQRDKEDSKR